MGEGGQEREGAKRQGGFFGQLFKYGGVSFAQTFVELGAFALLRPLAGFSAANGIAVVCSATFQYVMNRNLTFKSSSSYARSIALFVLLWAWNLAFSSFAIAQLVSIGWGQMFAKLVTMACQGVWGFLLSKYVIFR